MAMLEDNNIKNIILVKYNNAVKKFQELLILLPSL